ncbi:MmcQ/YjbR family DNA-binding protein [Gymnodinialimonas ceratoperidinii]|uniref:MmcQ/YjbR family DNA-binding protein n=1 Tax=Gymnodinialimonas ceratoperidinii TaxID=2856823 RepID=A0A8F6TTV2_9RHOB|nr:MmcQ/YjbR family DNA-binding protein [Gymnodinialimonas ceratoperidinii]QXT38847.1 MmcQ/YjbR family DNA-binding protein [Gymnodinialimonas ceratoperidinii]
MSEPIRDWPELRAFALSLDLPKVEDAVSWGNPNLKAHGKLWCWWSPYIDAAIFKGSAEERDMLMAAAPETFVIHDHYVNTGLILVAGGKIERDWAEARLRRTWRALAPKKWLASHDATSR